MPLIIAAGIAVLCGSVLAGLSTGAVPVPARTILGILLDRMAGISSDIQWTSGQEAIIWDLRFPRGLLACMVGAGLALVGAALQAVSRNPLADPHLLGISSGAAVGAVIAILHTGLFIGPLTVPVMAFAGAMISTFIVIGITGYMQVVTATRLLLTGVAVSFIAMAIANLLIFLGDARAAHTVVYWMLGGLGLASWNQLSYPLVVLMIGLVYFWMKSRDLNSLTLGDETAATLGVDVERVRVVSFIMGAFVTGVMVAYSGIIGFVGLMIPHMVRMLVGGDHMRVIPLSAITGGIFLVWADIAARSLLAPEDLPIGIVTGLIGGTFFIWLLGRKGL